MLGPVVMPMDMAMRFYLAQSPSPPVRGLLASSPSSFEDLQRGVWTRPPHHRPKKGSSQRGPAPLRPCLSGAQRGGAADGGKKRVVFADAQGLALTAVRLFSDHRGAHAAAAAAAAAEDLIFQMSDLEAVAAETEDRSAPLELDFRPPGADYLEFRSRLLRDSVCLESCVLRPRSLSGTVKVRNLGFSKAVALRLTADAWASFGETACTFVNDVYAGPDTDTFAFALEPPATRGGAGMEFCVCFRVEGREFWDNNDGRNYALRPTGLRREEEVENLPASFSSPGAPPTAAGLRRPGVLMGRSGVVAPGGLDMEADQFGSPRTSSGLFPRWQSWGPTEASRPYW